LAQSGLAVCLGQHNTQGTSPSWVNKQGKSRLCL